MLASSSVLAGLMALGVSAAPTSTPNPDFTAAPPANISYLPNATLWDQWRPVSHFIHPSNQLGDPTAFWFDRKTGQLHISALYSYIRGTGNSSLFTSAFAGATTTDLLHYEDVGSGWSNNVWLGPGNEVDFIADFDGGVIPEGVDGNPTLLWTAVKGLPISWSIPYNDGYETVALASSPDGGKTWVKQNGGDDPPIIEAPPLDGNRVTGFRDPWPFQNKQIDRLLNLTDQNRWYLTLSGGIHDKGPCLFFYVQRETGNFNDWDYKGSLLSEVVNSSFVAPGSGWAGSDQADGSNYETAQITSLGHEGDDEEDGMALITMGAESGRKSHNKHWSLYRMGHWAATSDGDAAEMNTTLEGVLDWGMGYACTGMKFSNSRRLTMCWIPEDFTSQDATKYTQEYLGALTLPRELFVHDINNVVDRPAVRERGNWALRTGRLATLPADTDAEVEARDGKVNITMLGIRPARELDAFRAAATDSWSQRGEARLPSGPKDAWRFKQLQRSPSSRHWEMETTIRFPNVTEAPQDLYAGMTLLRSQPSSPTKESIDVVYRPANESLIIYRNTALTNASVNTDPEVGKLRLWHTADGQQDLQLRVFLDGSTLEVFANDVLAISTRAYYWYPDSTRMGFTQHGSGNVTFSNTRWWSGLIDAFPSRPKDKESLIKRVQGYPEPDNNPNAEGIIYNGTGPVPPFPNLS